jgi:GT2 family glycosyltransferase
VTTLNHSSDPRSKVSVVIPNWNGRHLLRIVLASLDAQTFRAFETIVVDNGSSDESVTYLTQQWPAVRVVSLEENRGFSAAVNAGIFAGAGRYVALVNNDVELAPSWIQALVDLMETDEHIASATGKLLDYTDRSQLQEAGALFAWEASSRMRGAGEKDVGQYDTVEDVFSVCAGASLYRRTIIDEIGGFDESFFAYFEDVDWGFRAQLAGYRAVYTPAAAAYHIGSATVSTAGLKVSYLSVRNTLAVVFKNYPRWTLFHNLPGILSLQFKTFIGAIKNRWGRMYIRAWIDFLWMLPELHRKRAAVRAIARRARTVAEIQIPRRHRSKPVRRPTRST